MLITAAPLSQESRILISPHSNGSLAVTSPSWPRVRAHLDCSLLMNSLALCPASHLRGDKSPFWPYIDSLPRGESDCLLNWNDEERAELKGENGPAGDKRVAPGIRGLLRG